MQLRPVQSQPFLVPTTSCWVVMLIATAAAGARADDRVLFDFEDAAELAAWSNLEPPDAAHREPAAKFEISKEHATAGAQSLKITFAGGRWPTITTTRVPDDWMPFQTFKADVTVARPCLIGFTVLQEKSRRGGDWDGAVSRWTKTALLDRGTHELTAPLHPPNDYAISKQFGPVVRFEIFMYSPHAGESIFVDNIRLTTNKETAAPAQTRFRVLGTDLVVSGVQELGQKLKGQWTPPTPKTVEQVEAEFRSEFDEIKKQHPRAVMASLRDGETGYDPRDPPKVYAGWKDAYWSSHGPDGMTVERSTNFGRSESQEVFMRHRSPLMRVDLSSIPAGSTVLTAKLVIVRASPEYDAERNPEKNPNMWVAEPCNRPWEEYEVNAYEYAKDKFWRAIGGMYWEGDDPDFVPVYIAHGPGGGAVSVWDFTNAVRFWTDGRHSNHGFMLHCDAYDWFMRAHYRESKEIKKRPAVLVVYEPRS